MSDKRIIMEVYHEYGKKYIEFHNMDDDYEMMTPKIKEIHEKLVKFGIDHFPIEDDDLNKQFDDMWLEYVNSVIEEGERRDEISVIQRPW